MDGTGWSRAATRFSIPPGVAPPRRVTDMFVDQAEIFVAAGSGGHGCVSFLRERFRPKGGPNGGNGGDGGSVYLTADPEVSTLLDLTGTHHWHAENGQPGKGSSMHGRNGNDCVIRVPAGTLVYDREHGTLLKDLHEPYRRVRVARGGRGGRGNEAFKSPTDQAPRRADPGEPGEERWLRLDLKLIADVGIVGLPNAGKSTLLSRLSRARPKIADYPFTTLEPQLGIVELSGFRRFVMADIPGLIAGAHEGVGLGDAFLRHIERTHVVLHLIDVCPTDGSPRPWEAHATLRAELAKYSPALAAKPELVVANKMDLTDAQQQLNELREQLGIEVLAISAVTGVGLEPVSERLWSMVTAAREAEADNDTRTICP
jgi:GTP-binding protein